MRWDRKHGDIFKVDCATKLCLPFCGWNVIGAIGRWRKDYWRMFLGNHFFLRHPPKKNPTRSEKMHWPISFRSTEEVTCKQRRCVNPTASLESSPVGKCTFSCRSSVNFSTLIAIELWGLLSMPCKVHNELRKWKKFVLGLVTTRLACRF